jgi:cyclophilin family peptidyl-prolyl cis-trans isomerase
MKKYFVIVILFLALFNFSCGGNSGEKKGEGTIVLIKTDKGDITVRLYDETPKHRDNFLKLAKDGFYDGLIFHRVIKDFMIQGGDPNSKNAEPGQQLGNGGPGYTIDAEFNPKFFHKKGALSAARQGDNVNPEKKSSGSQFYIVQGEVIPEEKLAEAEKKMMHKKAESIFRKLYSEKGDSVRSLQQQGKQEEFTFLIERLQKNAFAEAEKNSTPFTPEQKEAYSTIGGTPHLDGGYTVFGEVIEGLNVIDSIATVKTAAANRPVEDIKMEIEIIQE